MDRFIYLNTKLPLEEGVKLKVYNDPMGIPTLGIGRNLRDKGISLQEALYLLENDLKDSDAILVRNLSWYQTLDEVRKAALMDMVFNMGWGKLSGFVNFLHNMGSGNFAQASSDMLDSLWAKEVGHRAQVLSQMIKTGEWQ